MFTTLYFLMFDPTRPDREADANGDRAIDAADYCVFYFLQLRVRSTPIIQTASNREARSGTAVTGRARAELPCGLCGLGIVPRGLAWSIWRDPYNRQAGVGRRLTSRHLDLHTRSQSQVRFGGLAPPRWNS